MAMTGGTAKLVKSGTPSGWPSSVKLYVYYKEKSRSAENNTTTLSLGMYITVPSGYWLEAWGDHRGSYVGTATSGSNCKSFDGSIPYKTSGTYWLVENKDITVTHKTDGTGSATIYWKWGVYSSWGGFTNPSGSFSVELTSIPRASSMTAPSSWTLGTAQNISISSKVSSYRHRLTYKIGSLTGTILDKTSSATSANWNPAYSLAAANTSGTSLSGTLTLETYTSSGAKDPIGSVSKSITLKIPDNASTRPSVSAVLTPVSSLTGSLASQYVQGVSKVQATITANGKYDASIASMSMSVDGKSYGSSAAYTSGYLANYGSCKITVTATDTRGRSASASYTISVLPYNRPTANVTQCARCKSEGTLNDSGTFLRVTATKKYSTLSVEGEKQNTCKVVYRYRKASESISAFSEWIEVIPASGSSFDGVLSAVALDAKSSFVIQFAAQDAVSGTNVGMSYTIPNEVIYWHRTEKGLALGMYAQKGGLEVAWDSNFLGDVYGMVFGLGGLPAIPSGADLNTYLTPGMYSIPSATIAKSLSNAPSQSAGTLRIWNGTGKSIHTGAGVRLVQEWVSQTGLTRYVRPVYTENTADQWTYGSWSTLKIGG